MKKRKKDTGLSLQASISEKEKRTVTSGFLAIVPVCYMILESINPAYGGAGSGGINDLYDIVSLNQGLENAGFSINQDLVDFYNNYGADNPEMSIQKQSWTLPEPPADTYSDELIESAKEYSDVAVVVLSRKAGEGHNDIPMDVKKAAYDNNSDEYDDFSEGEHYLQLSQTERDMVDMVCSNFENVIVIYNGANQFELGFADEYPQIKSVVWCPGTGNVGFNALGKVFSGEVNPSGKTPDTFIYDMTTAPWWNNAEKIEYTNLADMAVEGMNAGTAQVYAPAFTNYRPSARRTHSPQRRRPSQGRRSCARSETRRPQARGARARRQSRR